MRSLNLTLLHNFHCKNVKQLIQGLYYIITAKFLVLIRSLSKQHVQYNYESTFNIII
jgi:hypothetical protein